MDTIRMCIAALLVVEVAYSSHLLDQYEDGIRPTVEATGNNLLRAVYKQNVPELQVECADGVFESTKKKRRKRALEEIKRKRRQYYQWQGDMMQASGSSFAVWQPQMYQVNRPYFIPVWGAAGQVPMYYPPQPIVMNRPYPPKGYLPPSKGYQPPKGYLPPKGFKPPSTTIGYEDDPPPLPPNFDLDTRFNFPEDDEDNERPIWDKGSNNIAPPVRTTTVSSIPTRRTRRPGQLTTNPPLIHNSENDTLVGNSLSQNSPQTPLRPIQKPQRTFTTQRPFITQRPFAPQKPFTTPRTENFPTTQRPPLSRCVWAVFSCCSANIKDISYACFEQMGCQGAFWDANPCTSDFAKAAVEAAMKYYNNGK